MIKRKPSAALEKTVKRLNDMASQIKSRHSEGKDQAEKLRERLVTLREKTPKRRK